MTYHIWIGFDEREKAPYEVAKYTLEKYATVPIQVHKLHHRKLRAEGYFTREWKINTEGRYEDLLDGRPCSTQFSFTRFLVPELYRDLKDSEKEPLAMFVDCDWVFREDISQLFKDIDPARPLSVVKHDYRPQSDVKMDNMIQSSYNRKLWSALMVFNMAHPDNALLTKEEVNTKSGRWLHNFKWLTDDENIGSIGEGWNWLPNHSEERIPIYETKGVHFTEGGPWLEEYQSCDYSDLWYQEYQNYLKSKLQVDKDIVHGI